MIQRMGRLALCVLLLSASGIAASEDDLMQPDLSLIPPELSWLLRHAEQGDVKAEAALGYRFAIGRGVPQNNTEAAVWTYRAATRVSTGLNPIWASCTSLASVCVRTTWKPSLGSRLLPGKVAQTV